MGINGNLLALKMVLAAACLTAASACTVVSSQEQSEPLLPAVAPSLETSDRSMADAKLQLALEKSISGEATRWENPESGVSGSVTPLKTWKTDEGTYCRAFSEKIVLASGKSLNRRGIACRTQSAVWETA